MKDLQKYEKQQNRQTHSDCPDGNQIMANSKGLFNVMPASMVRTLDKGKYPDSNLNLFGKKLDNGTPDHYTFFTGKPHVSGLGYSFLFRNYREDLSKWQTSDPLGYPDGWNNFAYVNNKVANNIDWLGGASWQDVGSPVTVYIDPWPTSFTVQYVLSVETGTKTIAGVTYTYTCTYYLEREYSSFSHEYDIKYYGGSETIGSSRTKETTAYYIATNVASRTISVTTFSIGGIVIFSETGIINGWSYSTTKYRTGGKYYIQFQSQIYE